MKEVVVKILEEEQLLRDIRSLLGLRRKELPNIPLKKLLKLYVTMIGEWVMENEEGFLMEGNGILIASLYEPKFIHGDKTLKCSSEDENYKIRVEKQMIPKKPKVFIRNTLAKDFSIGKIMWFNRYNTSNSKADCFKFTSAESLTRRFRKCDLFTRCAPYKSEDFLSSKTKEDLEKERKELDVLLLERTKYIKAKVNEMLEVRKSKYNFQVDKEDRRRYNGRERGMTFKNGYKKKKK